jgi:peptide/nickel transport system substrate-binding protein
MARLDATTDPAGRSALLRQAQTLLAQDHANGWLFQLPKTGVADARLEGLWENAPMPANDLTEVRWKE